MFRFFFSSVLIILIVFASLSLAGIPKMINYQGMLTDNSGTPLSGSYTIIFKIYNDPSAGTKKWEETQSGVSVTNGLFNVILGNVTPISLDFSEDYWLDITVGAEHMPSRLKFTSVGYAYRAQKADTASVAVSAPTGGGWTNEGKVVRLVNSSDSVGIGTTSPQAKLHISGGDVRMDYSSNIRMIQGNGYSSDILKFGNDLQFCNFATGYIDFRTDTSPNIATARLHITNNGNIGLGTINPERILHIVGVNPRILIEASSISPEVNFKNTGDSNAEIWALYKHGTTDDLRFYQNGDKVTIQNSTGNVGIGTDSPGSYKLAVNGSAAKTGGGSWSTFSDERLKDIRANYEYGLSEIDKLKPIRYGYRQDNELGLPSDQKFVGLIAQDVEKVIPDAVKKNDKGYLMLNNDPIIWAMLNAIKELKSENEELKKRIEMLEDR